ncbi:MAG: L-threonylcarbamoyladenylate synthase [Treponema sp.]|nr:L-threonylcarbamoyladenylate synthase [Treponema sp.]
MAVLPISDESIRQAAQLLFRGGIVAFPTETVYGLGADAFNPAALARVFAVKNRPRFDPLIVHIAALEMLETIADLSLLDTAAQKNLAALAAHFWPGPLTLIVPKRDRVPDLATSGLPTVAVRFPAHDAARRLIAAATGAVAAPSANPFGYLSPTRAEHVAEMLGAQVDLILDGGPSSVGLESTVLDLCHGNPRILRPGGTPKEAIEALIGPVLPDTAADTAAADTNAGLVSPGLLQSHYAPHACLVAHNTESLYREPGETGAAFLFFDGASRDAWLSAHANPAGITLAVLSETGTLLEAAAQLFELLHALDRPDITRIHAQLAPEEGLGAAINDRLRKAEGK